MSDIKTKSVNAAIWSAIDKFSEQGIRFILGLVVARLLFPSDYGLIGMLAVFMALPDVLVNSGFSAALIQKKNADETDFSTVFYFNIFVGLVLYLALYLSAPLVADFFEEPKLVNLTRVLGLSVVINSFGLVQRTILTKHLDFKTQTKISISSILPSGIIGILFAYYGYGVWAIVFQSLSRRFLTTLFFWVFNKWRPQRIFNLQSLKTLFAYGSNLLIAGIIHTIFDRIYLIIIGKFYHAETLGYFTRAKQFVTLPSSSITAVLERIAFPVFSTLQNDNQMLLAGYRKSVKMAAFINFPIMLGLIVLAEPLIRFILTDKWLPAVPYLQLLAIAGLLAPMHTLALSVIKAKGDSRIFLNLDIVKKVIATATILVVYRWGVIAIIYSNIVLGFMFFYMNFFYAGKRMSFSFGKQLLDLLPYILVAGIMAGIMFVSRFLLPDSDIVQLIVSSIIGVIVYFAISALLKLEAYKETIAILASLKRRLIK
jgi:O-antigen/teichoic acid export membrane protein